MSLLTNKQTIIPSKFDDPVVKPSETESIKPVAMEKGLEFFQGQFTIRVANRLRLRQKAYGLLYELYSKMGITQNEGDGLWLSIYDALPETTTFVAEDDRGCSVGALTVVFDSPIGLPADELYEKEIDILRKTGVKICEFVSLGIKDERKSSLKVLAGLFYCAFLHAWQRENSTILIITVHSRYENFYRRKLFFEKMGPERNYAKVNGAPTVLLNLSLAKISRLRHNHRIFPFIMLNYTEQEELDFAQKIENMTCPMSDEEFFSFFIEKTDIWEKASPRQKNLVKAIYPPYKVNHHEVSRALAKGFSKKYRFSNEAENNTSKIAKR